MLVTTAVLACAVASAPLFLSSARSAALQQQLAPQCAEAAWPPTYGLYHLPAGAQPERGAADVDAVRQGWLTQGRNSQRVLQVTRATGAGGNPQYGMLVRDPGGAPAHQPADLFWRPGVTDHVRAEAPPAGAGVWLPASYATALGARVGDRVTMSGVRVPVAGVYTDLFATDPGTYWCDYRRLYLNLTSANVPPPALVLTTDEATFYRIASAAGFLSVLEQVPVDPASLSSTSARAEIAAQGRALAATGARAPGDLAGSGTDDRLATAVDRAAVIGSGLRGSVVPVAVAGGLLALVLVASAGSFWADRRAAEVRLLAARGMGPGPLAGKAALELALPALVGAAADGPRPGC